MRKTLSVAVFSGLLAVSALAGCGGSDGDAKSGDTGGDKKIVLGFSQVGSESGWRSANTESIKAAATAAGIELKFSDGQNKQEKQLADIRSFITQGVDVIAFSPVVTSGWDEVLKEAKDADIPVILTDRSVDSQDTSLFKSFIGSDFKLEGEKAGEWLVKEYEGKTGDVNIVELQGETGSAPALDRQAGFADKIKANPSLKIVKSQTGNFKRADGKTVMETFLQSVPKIDVLYAHNDDMGLGAIEAIEAAGKKPGQDIKIITVDAVKDGMTALAAGKINFIVECSPLLGDQLMETVKKVHAGETVEQRIVTKEGTFTSEQAKAELPNRKY